MTITIGLIGEQTTTVTASLTAQAFGSGSLPVYATPALIALMESAAVSAINDLIPDHQTSVGTFISIKHLAATASVKPSTPVPKSHRSKAIKSPSPFKHGMLNNSLVKAPIPASL